MAATEQNRADFREIADFSGIIDVIGVSHVKITAPKNQEEAYVNRKGYNNINAQVVVDVKYRIIDIMAKWPWSVHGSRILNNSGDCTF